MLLLCRKGVIEISPVSDAKKRANNKWIKANYTQVKLSMPNEEAEILDKYCKEKGHTKAGFIRQAIKDKIARNE